MQTINLRYGKVINISFLKKQQEKIMERKG